MVRCVIANGLCKAYGHAKVLNDVTFSVNTGEIFGLLGPNGAGKSTLIGILSGLIKPTSGTAFINFLEISKERKGIKKLIGVALQSNSFYESLTVEENAMYFGSLYGVDSRVLRERMGELLELFSLSAKRNVAASKLSGGMRKKLNILCALIHDPEILIMDEPTAGLDPVSKRNLWDIIKQINKRGKTIIITSHLMEDVEALCDRVAIMVSGSVIIEGPLHTLKNFVQIDILRIVLKPDRVEEALQILERNGVKYEAFDNVLMIRTKDAQTTYNLVGSVIGPYIALAEIFPPSIEDVFLYFVGRERWDG